VRVSPPRLGFVGAGWIGRHRLEAVRTSGAARVAAFVEPEEAAAAAAAALAPEARRMSDLDALLALPLDGVVIATPSALHAAQARQALGAGMAVFCQKPLGRTAAEAEAVLDDARRADRLLGVDFSYRTVAGVTELRDLVQRGGLGRVYAAELAFHNAYGPGKPWFYDVARSGGGCLMDLGIHLVDLALWTLATPVARVQGRCFAGGRSVAGGTTAEDYALAQLDFADGAVAQIACSWRLPVGRECDIRAAFHGTEGSAVLRNVGGSFYDFEVAICRGTREELIARPPDPWGGRALIAFARRLAQDPGYDIQTDALVSVHRTLDAVYCASAAW
jgi:predicted dehydrogenase